MSSAILEAEINKIGSNHIISTARDTTLGKQIALTLIIVFLLHVLVLFAVMQIKSSVKQVPVAKTIAVRLVSLTPDQPKPLPPKPIVKPKIVPVVKEQPKPKPLPILVAPKAAVSPVAIPTPVAKPIEKPTPISEPVAAQPPAPVAVPQKAEPAPPKVVQGVAYLIQPNVVYPDAAAGATGTTIVRALINVNGMVDEVTVQRKSGNAQLDRAALQAVKKARFKPYRENGEAQAVYTLIPIAYVPPED
ncbi:MAG: TonB family protein [Candidatus Saccharibacteria bacterium]|nr:TonB family protein [Moraxellaceae bacterium]